MKILLVSANPIPDAQLSLDEELRAIEHEIRASQHRDAVALRSSPAARPLDLIRELNNQNADIIHFSGHGDENGGIVLVAENGGSTVVTPEVITELFGALEKAPRIVLLNSCFSFAQANELVKVVDVAIGIPGVVSDKNAIDFSTIFYMVLSSGASVSSAFRQAVTGVKLNNANYWQGGEPVVLTKQGINLDKIVLVGKGSTRTVRAARQRASRRVFRDRDTGRGFLKREFDRFAGGLAGMAIVFLDVQGMGKINQNFGRRIGDMVISEIIVLVEDGTPDALACGICGDDTFFCVTEGGSRNDVMEFGRSLMTIIENNDWSRIARDLYVRVHGGFAIWKKAEETASEVVLRAGEGLRTSQTEGGKFGEGDKRAIARRLRGYSHKKGDVPEEILRELFS